MKRAIILILLAIFFALFLAAFAMDYELAEPIDVEDFSLSHIQDIPLPTGAVAVIRIPKLNYKAVLYDNDTDLQPIVDADGIGAYHDFPMGRCIFDHHGENGFYLERLQIGDRLYISFGADEELYRCYAVIDTKFQDNGFALNGKNVSVPTTDLMLACCGENAEVDRYLALFR